MSVFWRYWLLQVPGWILLLALAAAAHELFDVTWSTGLLVFALWLLKDAALYPVLSPYYGSAVRDDGNSLVGESAIAQERLSGRGYVKLRGELWLAELGAEEPPIEPGEAVVVEAVDGLTLRVTRTPEGPRASG